jgi:hypothetical protein
MKLINYITKNKNEQKMEVGGTKKIIIISIQADE